MRMMEESLGEVWLGNRGDYWVGGSKVRQNGVLVESVALGIGGLGDAGVSLDENESICFGSESAKGGVSSAYSPC